MDIRDEVVRVEGQIYEEQLNRAIERVKTLLYELALEGISLHEHEAWGPRGGGDAPNFIYSVRKDSRTSGLPYRIHLAIPRNLIRR